MFIIMTTHQNVENLKQMRDILMVTKFRKYLTRYAHLEQQCNSTLKATAVASRILRKATIIVFSSLNFVDFVLISYSDFFLVV